MQFYRSDAPSENLAGHDTAIFLFRFDLTATGVSFVLNEGIAPDMYADIDKLLLPLTQACGESLLRYQRWSSGVTILDCIILTTGECEIMLSPGLGKYIPEAEKQRLFADAGEIANLLSEVVARRTKEEKTGKRTNSAKMPASADPTRAKGGLERLGRAERRRAERERLAKGERIRPGLKQLRPEDLPPGVTAAASYDHRGHSVTFEHESLGELGRIILMKVPDGETLIQAEFYLGQEALDSPRVKQKQRLFEEVAAIVQRGFEENFPQ